MRFLLLLFILTSCNEVQKLGDCYININTKPFGPYLTDETGCRELKNFVSQKVKEKSSCSRFEFNLSEQFSLTDDVKVTTLNEKGWKVNEVLKIAKRKISKQIDYFLKSNCE